MVKQAVAYFNGGNGYADSWNEKHQNSSNWYNRRQTEENIIKNSDRFSYIRDDDGWSNGNIWYARQKAQNAASATLVGSRVFHETFGYGKVLKIEGNKLKIRFNLAGHKKLMKDYVKKI